MAEHSAVNRTVVGSTPTLPANSGNSMSEPTKSYAPCDPPKTPYNGPFKMEAVVICDRYDDFLRHTLPHNKFLFDKLVVVTSYEDKATRRLCEFHHVECITTDDLQARKGRFCKGTGINIGLDSLSMDDWVVHLDADIYLPPQTRILLQRADLDKRMIYGIDRFSVRGFKAWNDFLDNPRLQQENEAYIHMNAFPLGTRVMQPNADGYIPIGFFQMWNPNASGVYKYPQGHTDAGREDAMFPMHWKRSERALIPEVIGYHLESDDATNAANWSGRTTSKFQ